MERGHWLQNKSQRGSFVNSVDDSKGSFEGGNHSDHRQSFLTNQGDQIQTNRNKHTPRRGADDFGHDSSRKGSGLRFSALENQCRKEESAPAMEGSTKKANTSEIKGSYHMSGVSRSSSKGSKSTKVGKGSVEPIKLRVSDPSLKEGMRLFRHDRPENVILVKFRLPSTKKTKIPTRKEITNILDAWTIKLKPNWAGLRSGSGTANKEGENVNIRANKLGPSRVSSGLPIFHFGDNSGGPTCIAHPTRSKNKLKLMS